MRWCTIWLVVLGLGCADGKSESVEPIPSAYTPPDADDDIEQPHFGGAEESETPLFGAEAEEVVPEEEFMEEPIVLDAEVDRGLNPTPMDPGDKPTRKPARTWKRSQITPNTTRLSLGDEEELPLQAMQATVRIDGFRARVVLDCVYRSDREGDLEGTFQLRLPNGASPFYLGFGETAQALVAAGGTDVVSIRETREKTWTQVKEARMVPKEKAAHAFAETVRRAVDPALLEWSGAGIFRARVYPLLKDKLHRIVVGYEVNLLPVGEDLLYRLDLPEKVPALDVRIDVDGEKHTRVRNPEERTFEVRVKKPGATLLVGKDAKAGDFFAAHFRPALAASPARPSPRGVFLVDTSLSANPERFPVWLKLLEAILTRNRATLKEFKVCFFGIETFWWRDGFVPNTAANVKALMRDADRLALEGATDVGRALAEAAGDHDIFLLSDGAATWGESDLHAIAKPLRGALFAYDTGFAGTDKRLLSHLARESGGAVFSVVGEAEVPRAATAHTRRPWRIENIAIEGGDDLLLAGRPTTLFAGQTLYLAGRGRPSGDLVITLKRDGQVTRLRQKFDRTLESGLAPGVYGQIAVRQLEEFGLATEEIAQAYALHFRVVGKTCSLLMLESDEDYERFDIKPTENACVIRKHPAAARVASTLREVGARLGDPKAGFEAWLRRLGKMPAVEFEMTAALDTALAAMPRASFVVVPDPLACKARTWKEIPGAFQEQLASRKLTYDSVTAEAARRRAELSPADGLKALSSLVENNPGDEVLARDAGFQALEWGLGGQAYHLFRRVAHARPYEAGTYHAMAACATELGKVDLALLCYEVACTAGWNERFGDFRRVVGYDYARFLRRIDRGELRCSVPDYARARLETLGKDIGTETADLVVTIAWNTDRTDLDLHVVDPNREECYYQNRETKIGGRLSTDVTGGYGPEMFLLKNAIPGPYVVRVKFYSTDEQRTSARTRVYVTIYEDWGRQSERVTRKAVTLAYGKQMHEVATVKK